MCLNAGGVNRLDAESQTLIAFHHNAQVDQMNFDPHTAACLTTSQQAAVCFSSKDYGADAVSDIAPTLRAMGHAGSHANGGGQLAVCLTGQVTHALNTCNNGKGSSEDGTGRGTPIVAFAPDVVPTLIARSSRGGGQTNSPGYNVDATCVAVDIYNNAVTGDVAQTLSTNGGSSTASGPRVIVGPSVRRLTETECERLQGFPDGHTDVGLSSGVRYKALGNSMAVPVIRWIGRQIKAAS